MKIPDKRKPDEKLKASSMHILDELIEDAGGRPPKPRMKRKRVRKRMVDGNSRNTRR